VHTLVLLSALFFLFEYRSYRALGRLVLLDQWISFPNGPNMHPELHFPPFAIRPSRRMSGHVLSPTANSVNAPTRQRQAVGGAVLA